MHFFATTNNQITPDLIFLQSSDKLDQTEEQEEEMTPEQMVTFPNGESMHHVAENGHLPVNLESIASPSENFYETSDANEYSEYCVPQC